MKKSFVATVLGQRLRSSGGKFQQGKYGYLTLLILLFLAGVSAVIMTSTGPVGPAQDDAHEPEDVASRADLQSGAAAGRPAPAEPTYAELPAVKAPGTVDMASRDGSGLLSRLTAGSDKFSQNDIAESEEKRSDEPDEARRFRRMQLRDDKGEIPIDALQKAREQMDKMRAFGRNQARAAGKAEAEVAGLDPGDWAWLGPGNVGGRIRSLVIDPNNPNNMWVGSVGGGIWKTTNAGAAWQPVNDFMANLSVSTMVINPNSPTIMYAGTGEGYGNVDALQGGGVFQSIDSGLTWNLLGTTNPAAPNPPGCGVGSAPCSAFWNFVNRLAISPNGATILAATNGGIAQSIDGGATWVQRTNVTAQDIDFDPNNNLNAVAGEFTACPPPPGPSCATSSRFSNDGGQTWTAAAFNPAITNGRTPATDGRVELAYAPSNANIVYAAVNNNNGDLYRSTDGGQNFNRANTGTNFFISGGNNQGWYDNIVWVNPLDPTFVIVGGIDLFRSTNSGTNFTQISRWQCGAGQQTACANTSAHADQHMIVAHPAFNNSSNKTVYFTNDGGIFRADDVSTVGQTNGWTHLNNNMGITQFYGGSPTAAGTIFGGAQDNGTVRVQPTPGLDPPYNPQTWSTITAGDGGYVAADPADANYLYGEQQNLALFRSSNAGTSATNIAAGITDTANANFIAPFILDPSDPNTMLAGSWSLWRSNDVKTAAAPTWTAVKPPAPPLPPAPGASPSPTPPISAIAVSPSNSSFIVAGHNDGQIFATFNGTSGSPTWNAINTAALPTRFVTRLAIDNTKSPNWIYATLGGFSNNNVWVTRDLGTTWIDVSGATGTATDLPAVPVRSILINLANPNFLYVGTEIGIFASQDAGATWLLPQDGPANVSVDELFWVKGKLAAATHGRGMYITHTPVLDLPACGFSGDPGPGCPSPSVRCGQGCCVPGDWDCPCTWNNRQIPTQNDDVVISCPITVHSGSFARYLRVDGRLTLAGGGVAAQEDVLNLGLIESVGPFSSTFSGNNLVNIRPDNAVTLRGIISVNQPVTLRGNVTNHGIINGAGMNLNGPAGAIQNVGGDGEWNGAFLRVFRTAQLASDVILNTGSVQVQPFARLKLTDKTLTVNGTFTSSGSVDVGTGILNFRGGQFQIPNPNNGDPEFGVKGTGAVILNPTGGTIDMSMNGGPGTFQPSLRVQSGTTNAIFSGFIDRSFTIDPGAVFNFNEGSIDVNGDLTVNGNLGKSSFFTSTNMNFNGATLTNNGSILVDFIQMNNSGTPRTQSIAGTGTWAGTSFQVGAGSGSPSVTTLANSITFNQAQFGVGIGSTLNLATFNLTYTGSNFFNRGSLIGAGTLVMQPGGGTFSLNSTPNPIASGVRIASGTFTPSLRVSGPFTIDPGATMNGGSLFYVGNSFTNNGLVASSGLTFGSLNFQPINQQLGGTGSFTGPGGQLTINGESTTALPSDLTYAGGSLFIQGRINTGPFTFSVPCTTAWQGTGEVVGNIRRTNLAACPGAAFAFGNPFTTIRFTSGTPPTEIAVNTLLSAPVGFPGAAQRTYLITPTGGSGYMATLRLHYLDSELNGNDETMLQLWRNDGTNWTAQGVTSRNTTDNWVEYAGVTQFSPWAISQLAPTAADVSVSGRVTTAAGQGIRNVRVTLTAPDGSVRNAVTGSFGYYRFDDVETGRTYVLEVASRRYAFSQPTRTISVNDELTDIDFVALGN